ncbi:MAG: GTPase ObgE [Phycisphaeraceae bacterium]|nr:GTPase ObgE [Phycisphaeraceae bacterium]
MAFIDEAVIEVRSGKGGDGAVSFRRLKYIPKGGPDGGDGGDGGSVILLADPAIETLLDLSGRYHWHAANGQPGGGKQCHGSKGEDLIVRMPPGSIVFDHETGQQLVDLDSPGARWVAARGGRGGFGNEHFKSSTNQTPRSFTPGEPAEHRILRIELKLIADIGLIGKPNAGKSTLLGAVSRAKPRVADYPFTTLHPNLGIAELPGSRRIVLADIPGLIEGASQGMGLGTQFLRHIERTRLLVHLLELEPADGSDLIRNYQIIRAELAAHSAQLAEREELLVLTKADLLEGEDDRQAARELIQRELGIQPLLISGVTGEGAAELLEQCWLRLRDGKSAHPAWPESAIQ